MKKTQSNQLFYSYDKWEDYQYGMYIEDSNDREHRVERAVLMFCDEYMCNLFMRKVCTDWEISCKQTFTNPQMNKIAWLGQAACCLYAGIHEDETREAWGRLTDEQREFANGVAKSNIERWCSEHGI